MYLVRGQVVHRVQRVGPAGLVDDVLRLGLGALNVRRRVQIGPVEVHLGGLGPGLWIIKGLGEAVTTVASVGEAVQRRGLGLLDA